MPFSQNEPATIDEGNAGNAWREILKGPAFLVNVAVNNGTRIANWDCIIRNERSPRTQCLTLFQQETQRAIGYDIIWEGRRFIPLGWVAEVFCSVVVAADLMSIHGGYEAITKEGGSPY